MTEVIGDVVQPLELIVPRTTTLPSLSGALILSGDVLYFAKADGSPTVVG